MFSLKNISSKLTLFTITLVSIIIIYFTYYRIIPNQEKSLYDNLYNRSVTTAHLSTPLINKAIELNDDILLLSQIQSIVKLSDVLRAYLIDNTGKVLIHNKTSQWDKTYNSPYIKTAVSSQKSLIQNLSKNFNADLLFSSKINPNLTLCIELSTQRLNQTLTNIKKNVKYNLLIAFAIIVLFTVLFVRIQITKNFKLFSNVLTSVINGSNGLIKIKKKDEFGKLSVLLNELINKTSTLEADIKQKLITEKENTFITLQNILNEYVKRAFILFDSNNKLTLISDVFTKTKAEISLNKGSHILETKELEFLVDPIKESIKNPNTILKISKDNESIEILPIFNKELHTCTIILFGN